MVVTKPGMAVPKLIPKADVPAYDAHVEMLMKVVWRESLNNLLRAGTEVRAAIRQADIAAVAAVRRFGGPVKLTAINGMALADVIDDHGVVQGQRVTAHRYDGRRRSGQLTGDQFESSMMVGVLWDDPPQNDNEREKDEVPIASLTCLT